MPLCLTFFFKVLCCKKKLALTLLTFTLRSLIEVSNSFQFQSLVNGFMLSALVMKFYLSFAVSSLSTLCIVRATPPMRNTYIPPCTCWTQKICQVVGRHLVRWVESGGWYNASRNDLPLDVWNIVLGSSKTRSCCKQEYSDILFCCRFFHSFIL